MKQEQFDKLFEGFDSDNFQEKLLDIKEKLSKENTLLEQTYETIKQKDNDIAKLRDTNQRLFLRVSERTNDGYDTEVEEKALTLNDLVDNIMKGD